LDLFTIKEEFKKLEGLTVTICGDIESSRVARSNIDLFTKMGININLCGPQALLPNNSDIKSGCKVSLLKDAAKTSDVLMFLRVQHERHEMFELETSDYNKEFGLNDEIISLMKDKAIIMHPGPVNRDVEIAGHLVEHPRSRIFKQMENGVYTRMAILNWLYENE
jgi:aspartate carbamoyltransferase catalytic subunit